MMGSSRSHSNGSSAAGILMVVGTLACAHGEALGEPGIQSTADGERRNAQQDVMRRAQAGDKAAYEQLYRENLRRVFALCLRLCGDASLAEEIAQDVFVRAWQKLGTFRGESAFGTWLHRLAVNVLLSRRETIGIRRKRHVEGDLVLEVLPGRRATPETAMDMETAIARLPEGARQVFVLHDIEGYRHEEIGDMLGLAAGTSKSQLHRARMALRQHLER